MSNIHATLKSIAIATLSSLALIGYVHAAAPASVGDNLLLKVNGMVCAFCAQGIEKRLTALPQTQSVYVNLAQKTVAVQAKPGQKFDSGKVKAEIVDAGYEVTAIDPTAKTTAQVKAELVAKK